MAPAALHPTDETLAGYGLGKIEDAAADEVMRHLEVCPDCKKRVALMPADSFIGRLRDAVGAKADTSRPDESLPEGGGGRPAPMALPPELAASPQYSEIRELGRGGMGVVYLARNTIMDRLEVLKVVNRSADRFQREIQSAARLHHPNVVGAYSAQRLGELLVFAMEYVEGEDLAQLVKARGLLPIPHACNYVYQAALGLQHAHEQGMVHRDIKPSNLILTREGKKPVVKILDFGLAKGTSETALDASITAEGAMLGTPDYIAPEQTLDAAKADIRSDIYALGCTLYHLLSGRPPFVGRSLYEILRAHHSTDATRLGAVRPEVPDELAAVVAKMMAKDPARRYATPAAVAAALTPFFKPGAKESSPSLSMVRPAMGRLVPTPAPKSPPPLPPTPPSNEPAPALVVQTPATLRPTGRLRRRGRTGGMVIAGLVLAAFAIAGAAGAFRVKTPNGTIVLEGLPPDAEVLVDGDKVTVSRKGDECVVTVNRGGPHALTLVLGGTVFGTSDATVKLGGEPFRVGIKDWVPVEPIPPAKGSAPDRTARGNGAGQWQVKDKELIQTDADTENCVLVFGDAHWTDYDFTFDVTKTDGKYGVSALVRASDFKNHLVFDLAGWQNRNYSIEAQVDGKFAWIRTTERAGKMEPNRNYKVEVRARGDQFVYSIDGQVIHDIRYNRLPRGGVGLRCWGGAVRVSSILVKSPDGKVLWEGPPDLTKQVGATFRLPADAERPVFGDWKVDGSELVQPRAVSGARLVFGDKAWTDYDFSIDAQMADGDCGFGMLFCNSGQGLHKHPQDGTERHKDHMIFVVGGQANHTHYLERGIDADKTDWLARTPLEGGNRLKKGEWYTARVSVRGSRVQCFVSDTEVFNVETKAAPAGFVGLMTWDAPFRFRNIKVTDPAGKVLLEGLPDLNSGTQKTEGPAKIDPKLRAAFTNRGDWSIDGDEIVQSNDQLGDCEIAFGDPPWTDYDFVCEAKVVAGFGGEISQTFRVTEGGRYEWVLGRWNGHCYSLGSVVRGQILDRVWLARLDPDDKEKKLDLDRWYKMEVRVRGPKVECFVDGVSVVKLDHDRHKAGRVGLRTFKTQARFRNLKVTDPTGKVLFEGLPDLPATTVEWLLDS